MGFSVTRGDGLDWKINLDSLRGYKKVYEGMLKGEILQDAAIALQKEAISVMRKTYLDTKVGLKRRNTGSSIENDLFRGAKTPLRKGSTVYEIELITNYSGKFRERPHIRWQEEGTKAMVDKQPYFLYSRKVGDENVSRLYPITKKRAYRMLSRSKRAPIKILDVPHPGLRARGFIKAANFFLKTQGQKFVMNFVRNAIKTRIK